jgi:hypothetical protein
MWTTPRPNAFRRILVSLKRQFRGGLSIGDNPTIFTDRAEAEGDAGGLATSPLYNQYRRGRDLGADPTKTTES